MVKSTSYQMKWYTVNDSAKHEIGIVTTQIVKANKQLIVVTQVNMKNMNTPWTDSTVANLKTLKPIRHTSHNFQRDIILNFGKTITGYYNDKTNHNRTIVNDKPKNGYFDSNLYPFLVCWLPLENDYKQNISIYDFNPSRGNGIIKASIKNVSSGSYQTEKNGIRNVWVVWVSNEIVQNKNSSSTYFIDKENRNLWKQEIEVNGRKMMMKLVE